MCHVQQCQGNYQSWFCSIRTMKRLLIFCPCFFFFVARVCVFFPFVRCQELFFLLLSFLSVYFFLWSCVCVSFPRTRIFFFAKFLRRPNEGNNRNFRRHTRSTRRGAFRRLVRGATMAPVRSLKSIHAPCFRSRTFLGCSGVSAMVACTRTVA